MAAPERKKRIDMYAAADQAQPTESTGVPEYLRGLMNPGVARLYSFFESGNVSELTASRITVPPERSVRLREAKSSYVNFAGVRSIGRRLSREYWEAEKKRVPSADLSTKEKRVAYWCGYEADLMQTEFNKLTDGGARQQRQDAFAVVGLTALTDKAKLEGQLHTFWDRYQGENNVPDVEGLARKIVAASMDRDQLNYGRLDSYLRELFPFFAVFGKNTEAFKLLVEDHVLLLASYETPAQERVEAITVGLEQDLPDTKKDAYHELAEYYGTRSAVTTQRYADQIEADEQWRKRLDEQIRVAGERVRQIKINGKDDITPEYVDSFRDRRANATGEYQRGEISYETYSSRLTEISNEQREKGYVRLETSDPREYAYFLNKILNDPTRSTEILTHELAHFREAARSGLDPRFVLDLSIVRNEKREPVTVIHPSVVFNTTPDKAMMYRVFNAPDELSKFDMAAIRGGKIPEEAAPEEIHEEESREQQQAEIVRTPEQIADSLLNYQTGEVHVNAGIDLQPQYQALVNRVAEAMERDQVHFPQDRPVVVISEVARAMMKKVVQEGERRQKEVALSLQGGYFQRENGTRVFVVAFATPASDFQQAESVHVQLAPALQRERAAQLAHATNLDSFFQEHGKEPQGFPAATVHLHYQLLQKHPSSGDFRQGEEWLSRYEGGAFASVPLWGVLTTSPQGEVEVNLVKTYRDDQQVVKHQQNLPVVSENDLIPGAPAVPAPSSSA